MADTAPALIIFIESDPLVRKPMEEVVPKIKGAFQLRTFAQPAEFATWLIEETKAAAALAALPAALPSDPATTPVEAPLGPLAIKLIVMATEPFKSVTELRTFREKIKPLLPENVPLLLTTFESPAVAIPKWYVSSAFNLMGKPFDEALLQEHLKLALGIQSAAEDQAVFTMKTASVVEMLKAVPMIALSEIGFITNSDREIGAGHVTKFYGKYFGWKNVISVFARTLGHGAGLPETTSGATKLRPVAMTYFGTGRDQLLSIRTHFPKVKELQAKWRQDVPPADSTFVIIGDSSTPGSELSGTLQRMFTNAKSHPLSAPPDAKATLPPGMTAVLCHVNMLDAVDKDSRFKDIPKIGIADKILFDEEYRKWAPVVLDIVQLPVERNTFFKKMAVLFPQLAITEDAAVHTLPWTEGLDVGQAVEITEISEVGLVLKYERPLPVETMRRFVLWQPMEAGLPILTGRCYKSEGTGADSLNHFVFYGMSDHEIKHVRVWIRENYIKSKQKG